MFQDEARFGRINDVRRCWAPKPQRPVCIAMLTHEYTYAYAAVEPATGVMDSLILPQVNTHCMQIFLDEVALRHPDDHIVMVLDGARWCRLAFKQETRCAVQHAAAALAALRARAQSGGAPLG